jgi:hypothetical protein
MTVWEDARGLCFVADVSDVWLLNWIGHAGWAEASIGYDKPQRSERRGRELHVHRASVREISVVQNGACPNCYVWDISRPIDCLPTHIQDTALRWRVSRAAHFRAQRASAAQLSTHALRGGLRAAVRSGSSVAAFGAASPSMPGRTDKRRPPQAVLDKIDAVLAEAKRLGFWRP